MSEVARKNLNISVLQYEDVTMGLLFYKNNFNSFCISENI